MNLSNFAPSCPVTGKFILLVCALKTVQNLFPKYMAFEESICPHNFSFFFFPSRVKLKHFEKFQDTAEALAGKVKD